MSKRSWFRFEDSLTQSSKAPISVRIIGKGKINFLRSPRHPPWTMKNVLNCELRNSAHFRLFISLSNLLTYQRGLGQIFSELHRNSISIWAFRKSTFLTPRDRYKKKQWSIYICWGLTLNFKSQI